MYNARLDIRLILLQYCNAFKGVVDTLKYLHNCHPPIFHCDIKPDNILFHNNLLKIIDFDNARINVKDLLRFDTPRYLPGYVLRAMRERRDLQCLDLIDLQMTVMTFLEIFVDIFANATAHLDDFREIRDAVRLKEAAAKEEKPETERWNDFLSADARIIRCVRNWDVDPPNRLRRLFSILAADHKDIGAYATFCAHSEVVIEELYKSACEIVLSDAEARSRCSLTATMLSAEFGKQMEKTLSSSTSNIFANFYPLLYLDYSKATRGYDAPAEEAAKTARAILGGVPELGPCLDVGSAFGSAAFSAAREGFTRIFCLDNSPVFQRLADLLWAEVEDEKWRATARCFLTPELLAITSAYGGFASLDDGDSYYLNLLSEKRGEFAAHSVQPQDFLLADYWSLNERLLDIADAWPSVQFRFIVCNNFLHWPVIGFEDLKRIAGLDDRINLRSSHLGHLLLPLLNVLGQPGVLSVIEPSQFFMDDSNSVADAAFHDVRFTNTSGYRTVHLKVYNDLLPKWFGVTRKTGGPPTREVKFTFSELDRAIREESPDCNVEIKPYKLQIPTDWRRLILGEFMMTMRNFTQEDIRRVISSGRDKIDGFHREFSELVAKETATDHAQPVECFYILYVSRPA